MILAILKKNIEFIFGLLFGLNAVGRISWECRDELQERQIELLIYGEYRFARLIRNNQVFVQ